MPKGHKILIAATCLVTFVAFIYLYANYPDLSDDMADKIVVAIASLALVVFFSIEFREKVAMPALLTTMGAVAVFNVVLWSWTLDKIPFNPLPLWIVFFMTQGGLLHLFLDKLASKR